MSKCPTNKRGHKWGGRETLAQDPKDVDARTCAGCGARGRVNKQGVTETIDAS